MIHSMSKRLLRTSPSSRVASRFDPQVLLAAEIHIQCREHDAASLARAMGISSASVGRVIAALRRKIAHGGGDLVSVKRRGRSHYEILDDEARERRWKRLRRLVAIAPGEPLPAGETIDDVIYGSVRS
jgi:hypothetical protein